MGLAEKIGKKLFLRWLRGKEKGWRMNKAWQALSGWKLLISSAVYLGVLVYDGMANGNSASFAGAILGVFGFNPGAVEGAAGINFVQLAAAIGASVGGGHKLWKAQAQRRAGARPAELLSGPGAVRLLAKQPTVRT